MKIPNLKLLLPLIVIGVAAASCQVKTSINSVPEKNLKPIGISGIGEGAVASQVNLEPRLTKEVSSCALKIMVPMEELQLADASNYGTRIKRDYLGRSLSSKPRIIVIHETVMSEKDTLALFKIYHSNDNLQVSYHMLVARDGKIIRVVPDENRAYGAGMSHFMGSTLKPKENSAGSINNIALHISLVSPAGFEQTDSHTGYTQAQYSSLAKQVLKWQLQHGIPMSRVTTHYAVDRSHSRYDPRSFHWDKFDFFHNKFTKACDMTMFAQTMP
jgi:N-acetyl-anhydromuramyl-L-alanine amidase AmpD